MNDSLIEELEKLADKELEAIVLKGENMHIHNSKANLAKRILEMRNKK